MTPQHNLVLRHTNCVLYKVVDVLMLLMVPLPLSRARFVVCGWLTDSWLMTVVVEDVMDSDITVADCAQCILSSG